MRCAGMEKDHRRSKNDFLQYKVIEVLHFCTALGNFVFEMGRSGHHAILIADHEMTRENRRATAGYGHIYRECLVKREICRRRGAGAI